MFESYTQRVESDDDKLEHELFKYVSKGDFSGDELRHAYYQISGVENPSDDNDRVHELYLMMHSMVDKRYPLNKFATLIETIEAQEEEVREFVTLISSLKITENEKRTLCSIAEKGRTGILSCHINNTLSYQIKILDGVEKRQLVKRYIRSMKTVLAHISDTDFTSGKVTFWFEES